MSLFKFTKSQLLKSLEWSDDSKDIIVFKYPIDGREIMMGSKLTVREGQVAIFVNKGKIADVFEPGTYKLTTSNLPFLTKLLSLPYGFNSPFYADVYFIKTTQFTNMKWGTSNPITMRDKEFGTIRIRSFGTYAFKVSEPTFFLKELFGARSTFKTDDVAGYLKSMLISSISDTIAESKISALDLACNLLEFNKVAKGMVNAEFNKLGITLTNLVIENISFPETVEKAIDTRSSMGVIGDSMDSFVKYQAAHALRESANNQSGGNVAGMGVGLGSGVAMGQMLTESLKSSNAKKTCPNCNSKLSGQKKFCGECGYKFEIDDKKECVFCGTSISVKSKFCGECGKAQDVKKKCKKCGKEISGKSKFCSNCGEKFNT